ncbi:hypothetical protein EVAR_6186_1 [Eumeta japonica]|uniref:Uncharacterized protein n=1 Tax=Eumeta variegata TaxID=151549 RepID=A0A4C1THF9_EUMVA|nr:hypothetical protein EVAR_6186_1 [Eumeta japonica]
MSLLDVGEARECFKGSSSVDEIGQIPTCNERSKATKTVKITNVRYGGAVITYITLTAFIPQDILFYVYHYRNNDVYGLKKKARYRTTRQWDRSGGGGPPTPCERARRNNNPIELHSII